MALRGVDIEISPEPEDPAVAAAVTIAVQRMLAETGRLADPAAYRSRWRRAGVERLVDPRPEVL